MEKYSNNMSKNNFKRHADLLLIGKEGKSNYVLIRGFNTYMYHHALHRARKRFVVIIYKFSVQQKH